MSCSVCGLSQAFYIKLITTWGQCDLQNLQSKQENVPVNILKENIETCETCNLYVLFSIHTHLKQ